MGNEKHDLDMIPIMLPKELYDRILVTSRKHQKSVADEIGYAINSHLEKEECQDNGRPKKQLLVD